MTYSKKISKYSDILENTNVNTCKDVRHSLDDALNYTYTTVEAPIEMPERNIKAILVNQMRHAYPDYLNDVRAINRMRFYDEDYYNRYRNIVLDQISKQHPFLSAECKRQKHNISMVNIIRGG